QESCREVGGGAVRVRRRSWRGAGGRRGLRGDLRERVVRAGKRARALGGRPHERRGGAACRRLRFRRIGERARACVAGVLRLDPRETSKRPPRESFLFRHLQLRDRTAVFPPQTVNPSAASSDFLERRGTRSFPPSMKGGRKCSSPPATPPPPTYPKPTPASRSP